MQIMSMWNPSLGLRVGGRAQEREQRTVVSLAVCSSAPNDNS